MYASTCARSTTRPDRRTHTLSQAHCSISVRRFGPGTGAPAHTHPGEHASTRASTHLVAPRVAHDLKAIRKPP
eukprot:6185859-Pleurochrysis_carterae.AAC.1